MVIDVDSRSSTILALEILQQMFTWIPMAQTITPDFVSSILQFSRLTDASNVSIATTSLSAICEMLTQNWMSNSFPEILMIVYRQIFEIMRDLTADLDSSVLDDLDEK